MIRKKLAAFSVAIACLMAVPNVAPAATQMDSGVWVDSYRIGNSRTGRMAVFFFADNENGLMKVCGNYYMWVGTSVHRRLQRELKKYRFFYNGRTLFTDASFLWRAPTEDDLGSQVTCRTTDIPFVANANELLGGRMPFAR
jgi:hypothetical protein